MSFPPQRVESTPLYVDTPIFCVTDNGSVSGYPIPENQTVVAPISLPSDALLPAYSTKCCHNSVPYVDNSVATSPTCSSPGTRLPSAFSSRNHSKDHLELDESSDEVQPPERMNHRFASAFYSYFLCGWGDGW